MKAKNRFLGTAAVAAMLAMGVSGSGLGAKAVAQDASVGLAKQHIYPTVDAAPADIHKALAEARREHKRVLLDFGGDWCPDCQVLNYYFHQEPNAELLSKNYVRVNVNIGHIDQNIDVAKQYGVALKGVPALSVVDPNGHVVYGQANEFSNMRHMQSADLTAFLEKWKR